MSKSRSGGSKGSRSNSTESEDSSQQRLINSPILSTSDTLGSSGNSFVFRNESTVPSSPPPSYQHVLEETRMKQSAHNDGEEEIDEVEEYTKKQRQTLKRYKTVVGGEAGGGSGCGPGGGGSGCGPGGGSRQTVIRTEILHKSSKEFYRAVAKQWGITCKMSDHCRCFDCQSRYFDCEYDKDEHGKNDGGLASPMFLTSMIHSTNCVLL